MKLVEACVFNLSQLGELCRIVDGSFAQEHSEIPWREMYGLRNCIVHDYEGVNLRLVWEIISSDIPELRAALNQSRLLLCDDCFSSQRNLIVLRLTAAISFPHFIRITIPVPPGVAHELGQVRLLFIHVDRLLSVESFTKSKVRQDYGCSLKIPPNFSYRYAFRRLLLSA